MSTTQTATKKRGRPAKSQAAKPNVQSRKAPTRATHPTSTPLERMRALHQELVERCTSIENDMAAIELRRSEFETLRAQRDGIAGLLPLFEGKPRTMSAGGSQSN